MEIYPKIIIFRTEQGLTNFVVSSLLKEGWQRRLINGNTGPDIALVKNGKEIFVEAKLVGYSTSTTTVFQALGQAIFYHQKGFRPIYLAFARRDPVNQDAHEIFAEKIEHLAQAVKSYHLPIGIIAVNEVLEFILEVEGHN